MEENRQMQNENNPKWKKRICSWIIFIVNVLLMFLGYQFIKDKDKNKQVLEEENSKIFEAISKDILKTQNEIVTDRENKLRDLNNSPKEVQQNQTTTDTTTTTNTTPAKKPQTTKTS
jgi:hypothetical protein